MKTNRKKIEEIKVCSECGIPLIWTFHFPYSEYFCINCGGHWGMLGAGDDVKATPELKKQSRNLKKMWRVICKYSLPLGDYSLDGCKKCANYNHLEHLSKKEKMQNKVATKILNELEGCF